LRSIGKTRLKQILKRLLFPATSTPAASASRKEQEWSIGIYMGDSPLHLVSPENVANPVLTREDVSDVPASFVADPFMVRVDHAWYMFFEVMNRQTRKGEIGLAISEDGVKWTYQQIVLTEPFHLSYPYIFEWMNDYYMIPETHKAGSIRLYKTRNFPVGWSLANTLISGPRFSDSAIVRYAGKWWLFTETDLKMKFDTLRLYYADDLIGPWLEHPKSPIIEGNSKNTKPAGRLLVLNNRVIRYAQDCHLVYGMQVRASEIIDLTTESYGEREVDESPILAGSGVGWNREGMHHIDPHPLEDGRWIACVDGWVWVNVEDGNRVSL
jgi:hypothetical protein